MPRFLLLLREVVMGVERQIAAIVAVPPVALPPVAMSKWLTCLRVLRVRVQQSPHVQDHFQTAN